MCGIAGFVGAGNAADIERMTDALYHRGPDDGRIFTDPTERVFLGHRRLAVLDIADGIQPMWDKAHTLCVVYNGEIYNHADLRRELTAKGHRFATDHSDTEVLVHGYREWGRELPAKLNGMFAFAIYDTARKEIFLSRDRFGEKPLYYAKTRQTIAFASDLDALTRHGLVARTINETSLQTYFGYGYLPAPDALYNDCFKLPAGHSAVISAPDLTITTFPYWQFDLEPDESLTEHDDARLAEELRSHVIEAVRRRMISDVPLGLFLSGGIDSSIILAATRHLRDDDEIQTFSIGFDDPSFDESAYAREVAAYFRTRHHESTVTMDKVWLRIPEILGTLGEPLGDPSYLPTYLLCEFARRHVTVALSGDGGDELFAGYDPFVALKPAQAYQALVPAPLHKALRWLVGRLPISDKNMGLDFKLRRTLMGLSHQPAYWNPIWMSAIEPENVGNMFKAPIGTDAIYGRARARWNAHPDRDTVDRALDYFTTFYLQDNILTKVDRAAMAHSLETRAVFLDNDLVDFARRLPNRFKYRNGERKFLLRLAFRDWLPNTVLTRPKKGFGIPLNKWLRDLPQPKEPQDVPGVRLEWVRKSWADHRARKTDHRLTLWAWLSLCHRKSIGCPKSI